MFGSAASAETSVCGIAGPDRPDERERPRGLQPRELDEQRQVELGGDDRAGEDDPRRGQRGDRRVRRPGLAAPGENSSVSATFGASRTLSENCAQPRGQRRRAGEHEVGAGGEALLGGAEAGGVDPLVRGDVIDAVVDDQRRVAARRSAPPPGARMPTGSALRSPSRRAARRTSQGSRRALSARTSRLRCSGTTSGESTCSPSAARGGASPRRSRRAIRARSRPASCGRRRPSDSTNSTRFVARQARHQVVLVGPQLGVPVGEADAHDVAAAQGRGSLASAP